MTTKKTAAKKAAPAKNNATPSKSTWRDKIPDEFLYPNKSWFEKKKKPVPSSIDGLEDSQLLIKNGGIMWLAENRGFESVEYDIVTCDPEKVVMKCRIRWTPESGSYEDPSIVFEGVASASVENTDNFWHSYLETCAENRSFNRAVRRYLNVNIVSDDEITRKPITLPAGNPSVPQGIPTPQGALMGVLESKGIQDFEVFKQALREKHKESPLDPSIQKTLKEASDFSDISASDCRKIIPMFR